MPMGQSSIGCNDDNAGILRRTIEKAMVLGEVLVDDDFTSNRLGPFVSMGIYRQ